MLNFSSQNHKFNRGFTLIEMIVVIAITAVIATMIFANLRSGGSSMDLNSDAEKLAGIIKKAQMMALSGEKVGSTRPAGYGVYITTDSYNLFADGGNYEYDGGDTDIQIFNFITNIKAAPNDPSIVFVPPKGIIYVYNVDDGNRLLSGSNISAITLSQTQESLTLHVVVNSHGEIDVRKTL